MIQLFGSQAEVAFSPHHWPTWGSERIVEFLSLQRDLYAYLHDQTLRLLNKGFTGAEIAEQLTMPPALENAWHTRGYYGSVSHNVKAVYQRYMGWFDGNPAHLWQHPPEEQGKRYVEFMGGADAVVAKARDSYAAGDLRWVAEVTSHVVFAEPNHGDARALLADALEQLGYGAENGPWRNFFMAGAHELRKGNFGTPATGASPDTLTQLTPEQFFDSLAIQVDGPRAADEDLTLDVSITDLDVTHRLRLRNGVLTHTRKADADGPAQVSISTAKNGIVAIAAGSHANAPGVTIEGDTGVLDRLVSLLDPPDPDFAVVTP